jgi:hypothetical protein
MSDSQAVLEIARTSQWANRLRRYSILVDGSEVGTVRNGETVKIPVDPGQRIVQVKLDWCRSESLTVAVKPGQSCVLEVGCISKSWHALEALTAIFSPHRYLYVRPA